MLPIKQLLTCVATLCFVGQAFGQGVEDEDLLRASKKDDEADTLSQSPTPNQKGFVVAPVRVNRLSRFLSVEVVTANTQALPMNVGINPVPVGDATVRVAGIRETFAGLDIEYSVSVPSSGFSLPLPRALTVSVDQTNSTSFIFGPSFEALPDEVEISAPGHSGRPIAATLQGLRIGDGQHASVSIPKTAKVFEAYDAYSAAKKRAVSGKLLSGAGIGAGAGMLTFGVTRFMSSRSLAAEAEAIDDPTRQSDFNDLSSSAKSADLQGKLLMIAGAAVTAGAFTYMFGHGKKTSSKYKVAKANLEALTPVRLADHTTAVEPKR